MSWTTQLKDKDCVDCLLVSFKDILHKRHYKIYTYGKVKGKKKVKLYRQILTKMTTATGAIKLT